MSDINKHSEKAVEILRRFDTGATRSPDAARDDPEGYLSPLVIQRFSEYMTKHRIQSDGKVRASDNWQKGMPITSYMKGLWRHFLHAWLRHRGYMVNDPLAGVDIEEDLCAIIFNAQGYLHEMLVGKRFHAQARAAEADYTLSRLYQETRPPTGSALQAQRYF